MYIVSEFLKQNNFTNIRFHDLRHDFITILVGNKVYIRAFPSISSHVQFSMNYYVHNLEFANKTSDNLLENMSINK